MATRVLSRPPSAQQRATLLPALARFRSSFRDASKAAAFLSVGDSPVDGTCATPTELAAWTLLASTLLNSDAALNK